MNNTFKRLKRRIVRTMALRGASAPLRRAPYSQWLSPQDSDHAAAMFAWAKQYLSKPHPQLGRKGAVCPFVPKALNEQRFLLTLRSDVTAADPELISTLLFEHVHAFKKQFPLQPDKNDYNSLLLVFSRLTPEQGVVIDEVHTRHKSFLMHQGIMLSQFHPLSDKPAIYNEQFKAYTAPLACIVVRHMGVHDIIFLAHNKDGFGEYKRRFGGRYDAGKVNNEHGYLDLYNEAKTRFNFV